jgi:hypothetical protein
MLSKLTLKQKNEQLNTAKSLPTEEPHNMESDPHGRNPHELGAKLDAGKTCVWQGALGYFPRAIEQVAAVSTFGAKKYAWRGWETVPDGINRYSDAMGRHLIEEAVGHVHDKDSGLLVAAHTAWNALARLELMLKEEEEKSNV